MPQGAQDTGAVGDVPAAPAVFCQIGPPLAEGTTSDRYYSSAMSFSRCCI
jgi:hypothetical protein